MTVKEIIENVTSRNTHKVCEAACEIIYLGQDYDNIKPFIKYLQLIKKTTSNLNMGGAFAPNQRFIDFAIETIEFHKDKKECSCSLFVKKYKLTNDIVKREIQFEGFNPKNEVEKGNIKILDTIKIDNKWTDYYLVKCVKCNTHFQVEEREGHFIFWNWTRIQ